MKLNCNVVISEVEGEKLAVPMRESFHGIIKINGVAGFILECLKKETSEAIIVEKLTKAYDVSREDAARNVNNILVKLREAGLLEE